MIFDETDRAFIAEVYPDRAWTVDAIAEALDKTPEQIRNYVKYKGLSRTDAEGCLTDVDKAFIEETFSDPAWTVAQIAEKLDVRQSQVRAYAYYKELKRPHGKSNPPQHDWKSIWELSQTGFKNSEIAFQMNISSPCVRYALNRMRAMSPEERERVWTMYAETATIK